MCSYSRTSLPLASRAVIKSLLRIAHIHATSERKLGNKQLITCNMVSYCTSVSITLALDTSQTRAYIIIYICVRVGV